MVHSGIRRDSLPGCGYTVWQDAGEFTFTTDSVFVAAFAHLVTKAQVLELGSGTGAISLFLAARGAAKVTGLEFNPRVTELMRRSIADNNLEDVVSVIDGDVREISKYFKTESMDLVIANPPYRNSGNTRKIGTAACHEVTADLRDFLRQRLMRCATADALPLCSCPTVLRSVCSWRRSSGFSRSVCNGCTAPLTNRRGSF